MKKRILLVLCICMISILAITGCGSTSTESILEQMTEKTKDVKSSDINIKMVMDFDSSESGTKQNMKVDLDMNAQTTLDPEVCKIDGKMNMSLLGMNQSVGMKAYTVKEGSDSYTTYMLVDGQKSWSKTKSTINTDGMSQLADFKSFEGMFANFQLVDEKTDINGVSCYKISGSISGNDLSKMLGSVKSLASTLKEENLSGVKANVDFYVNAKDMTPVQVKVDLKDSDLSSAFGTSGKDLKANEYSVTVTYNGMNTVDKIDVPDDVKNNAVEGLQTK
jgi:outer membrane lipoprotein-sorting protein